MAEEKTVLRIEGMSCDGCKRSVTIAIQNTPGVKNVVVDLLKKEAEVVFDNAVGSKDRIIEAVNATGIYTAHE